MCDEDVGACQFLLWLNISAFCYLQTSRWNLTGHVWRHYSNIRITISQMTFSHMIPLLPMLNNWKEFKYLVVISWIWLCWRSKKSFPLVWPFPQLQCYCCSNDSSNPEQMTSFMSSLMESIMNLCWVKMIRIFKGSWISIILETIVEGLVSSWKY